KAVYSSLADQAEDQVMTIIEYPRVFHPDRSEVIDVEKAAVIDFLRSDAPEGQPVRLAIEEAVQEVEALRLALHAVESSDAVFDVFVDHLGALRQCRETSFCDLLFPVPFPNLLGIARVRGRQVAKGLDHAQKFQKITVILCHAI